MVSDSHDDLEGTAALHMLRSGQIKEEGKGKMVATQIKEEGKGKMAAALSTASSALYIISFPTPTWVAELKASYGTDSAIKDIIAAFQEGNTPPKGFSLMDGLLFFKGRIYLGSNSPL